MLNEINTRLAALDREWDAAILDYRASPGAPNKRAEQEHMAEADKADPHRTLIKRRILHRQLRNWHGRMASIRAQRVHPSERQMYETQCQEARDAIVRDAQAALAVADARDTEFLNQFISQI